MNTNTPVFFLTDFGYQDTYVAQMKAVVLSFAGYDTPLIDLTHSVEPGNILQGAYHLATSLPELPEGSVTVVVVDPGVGSSRKALAARWNGRLLVLPDNGLISLLPGVVETWELPFPDSEISSTFHGKDVFAPAAARLVVDPGWIAFLKKIHNPVIFDSKIKMVENSVEVPILHIDHFGNCILGIMENNFSIEEPLTIIIKEKEFLANRVLSYFEAETDDSLLFLVGSSGYFELALNGNSAADLLNLSVGDIVFLIWNGE